MPEIREALSMPQADPGPTGGRAPCECGRVPPRGVDSGARTDRHSRSLRTSRGEPRLFTQFSVVCRVVVCVTCERVWSTSGPEFMTYPVPS